MKLIRYLLAFFLLILASTAYAQTPTPIIDDVNINSIFNAAGASGVPQLTGVNCGIPGGLGSTSKCCVINTETTETQKQITERIPEFFCLPEALGKAAGGIGGLFGDVFDVVTQSIGFVTNVVTLDLKGAGGNIIKFATPDKTIGAIMSDDKICLSDAATGLTAMGLGLLPYNSEAFRNQQDSLPQQACIENADQSTSNASNPNCVCKQTVSIANVLCERHLGNSPELGSCSTCAESGGFYTGVGCINFTTTGGFAGSLITLGLGFGGGLALLCVFYAAFILQTSRGNPERIKKAKENLRACITGLLLIIFSILIVRLVGVTILRIPGFN